AQPEAVLADARRLDGRRQARRRARDRALLDLERLVEQVVRVREERDLLRAGGPRLRQPRIDGHREREPRPAVAERADGLRALIQIRHDDQPREVLAVLVAREQPEVVAARKLVGRAELQRVAALREETALR